MGLDGVELVMAIEERFGVSISDEEAERSVTPRIVGDIVFSSLQSTDEKVCQSQRAFYILRRAFMRRYNLKRASVTPDTDFRTLIDTDNEKHFWLELKNAVKARSWPGLKRPRWVTALIAALTMTVFGGTLLSLSDKFGWEFGTTAGSFTAAVFGFLAIKTTRNFKACIPSKFKQIRDLVPYTVTSDEIKWTREQVSALLKKIIIDQLGISESEYREDADFVKDFGLDQ